MAKIVNAIRSFVGVFWSSKFWIYFAVVFVCSIIVVTYQIRLLRSMEKNYDAIVARSDEVLRWDVKDSVSIGFDIMRYRRDLQLDAKQTIALQSLINDAINESVMLSKSDMDHNALVQAKADIMYEELNSLLRLHNESIQNDYETMEIWCGLMTIVFLLFSFFSLYKTDELVKQGEDGLKRLGDVETKAKEEVIHYKTELQGEVEKVKMSFRGEINNGRDELMRSNSKIISSFQQDIDILKGKEEEISAVIDEIKKNLFIFNK